MTQLTFRRARPEDAFAIEPDEEGTAERSLYALPNHKEALAVALQLSPTCTAAVDADGNVVALAGLVFSEGQISPWLIRSALAKKHRFQLARKALVSLRRLRALAPAGTFIYNHLGKESHQARAFVQRLGFRIVPSPAGPFDLFYLPNV